jgi:Bifunctional DNA primase/polymerase, N-terminal/AAA domain
MPASNPVTVSNPTLDAAIAYAERGWPVFPCDPATKQPYTSKGFKAATRDVRQISSWWARHPSAMIGVPTGVASGVWVLDIDMKSNANGAAALAKLEADNGVLPTTPKASTPSGGTHYYFKHQADVKNRGGLEPGIDVRGEGGYVIVPGSVKDDGTYYEWQCETEPTSAPAWLLALVIKAKSEAPQTKTSVNGSGSNPAYSEAAINSELQKLIGSFSNRNNQLNDSAYAIGQFVGAGEISYSEAETRLFGAAMANGYVGKDGGVAARATIKSGLDAGQQNPRKIPEPSVKLVAANDNVVGITPATAPIEIFWHGKEYNRPDRSWLVKDLILENSHGLASGQWGACKTFGVIDLSASVMTGTSFAGREVCKRGGVLFIAAEGAHEIPVRLKGVVRAGPGNLNRAISGVSA